MNIPHHISESSEIIFCDKYTIILWRGSGSRILNLSDPGSGMKRFGSGINIPGPHHWSLIQPIRYTSENLIWIGNEFITWPQTDHLMQQKFSYLWVKVQSSASEVWLPVRGRWPRLAVCTRSRSSPRDRFSSLKYARNNSTVERLRTRASRVGSDHSRKESSRQLVNGYSEHLHMSPRQYVIMIGNANPYLLNTEPGFMENLQVFDGRKVNFWKHFNFLDKKITPITFEHASHTEIIHQLHAYLYTLADSKNRE